MVCAKGRICEFFEKTVLSDRVNCMLPCTLFRQIAKSCHITQIVPDEARTAMIRRRRAGARRLFTIQADEAASVSFPVEIKTFEVKQAKKRGPKLIPNPPARRASDNPVGVARPINIRSALTIPSIDKV